MPKNTIVYTSVWTDNGGDHEGMDMCSVCGKYLNEFLTWIQDEFEHHIEYSITKEEISDPNVAFELYCMFSSMPSCDYENWRNGCNTEQKEQDEFFIEVINYAQLVIDILEEKEVKNG